MHSACLLRGTGLEAEIGSLTMRDDQLKAPSRRHVLQGGAALVGAGFATGAPALLFAQSRRHAFTLGAAEVIVLSDGVFTLPRSLVLPDAPEADVAALFKAHGAALELVAETNVTVVRSGTTVALLDTGAGPDFMPSLGKLPDRLDEAGIKSEDVTHVIFTHAHADHLWGVIDPLGDESRWPKARHVMPRVERDFWLQAGVEDKVPEFQKSMAVGTARRLKSLGEAIITAVPGEEVAPGIALIDTAGHTPGHCSVVVRSGTTELIVGGDALTHAAVSFGAPQWKWGSDIDWQKAATSRQKLLEELAAKKSLLAGYHLPWPGVGRVEKLGAAFRFVPGA